MSAVAALASRAALDAFFSDNPKVAGALAACADAGLGEVDTRALLRDRGMGAEYARVLALVKRANQPFDLGGHSALASPGLPGRSTPFRAPDAPGSFDPAKAPKLPGATSRPPEQPEVTWGGLAANHAGRVFNGAKGGLTAALGGLGYGATGVARGAVGAANWMTGTPSEQSPWANYLSGAQQSLGDFTAAGAQNVANAFDGQQQPGQQGFDALGQQYAQHKAWADQALPGEWNNLPGQASNVGGLAASLALGGKAMTALPGAAGSTAGMVNQMAPRALAAGVPTIAAGAKWMGAQAAGQVPGTAVALGANRYMNGPQPEGPAPLQFPDSVDLDVSQLTPQHAVEYYSTGMRGFDEAVNKLKLSDPNDPSWRQKAVPELAGPLRSMVVGVAATTKQDPKALFAKVMQDGPQAVDFDHLQTLASAPGNEAFAQPDPAKPPAAPETMGAPPPNAPGAAPREFVGPPNMKGPTNPVGPPAPANKNDPNAQGLLGGGNPVEKLWGFLNNEQVDPWARAGVAVGIPLAVIGALSGLLGEGGIGSLLMTVFGIGSTLAGAHAGGLADLGKAFGTLTGGWGGGGQQPAADPNQPAGGAQAAAQAPAQSPADQLQGLLRMDPQSRVKSLFPPGAGATAHTKTLTDLSDKYDPDQLASLLQGASPDDISQIEGALQKAPSASFFGLTPSLAPGVKAEIADAIQRYRAQQAGMQEAAQNAEVLRRMDEPFGAAPAKQP